MADRPKPPRAGMGRPKGSKNKATAEIRALAREYSEECLTVLASIMRSTKAPPQARTAAAKELLDRGWGKAPQAVTNDEGGPLLPTVIVHRLLGAPATTDDAGGA